MHSIFAELTSWILETVRAHGVVGVTTGVLIEAIIAPIPSPIVLMTAGFVLVEPTLALGPALFKILLVITLPAALAGVIGNYVVYGIAYVGGKPLIKKWKRFLGFSWKDIRYIRKKFELGKSEELSLVLLRALPVMPLSLISAGAGVLKIEWKKFGIFSLLGMIPRNFVLAFIGWKMSGVYAKIAEHIDNLETLITLTLVAFLLVIVITHKYKLIQRLEQWATR